MKEKIHPNYGEVTATCACGASFVTGSTKKELRVDVCSKCHPFFTGQQRNVAARGRIEKYNKAELAHAGSALFSFMEYIYEHEKIICRRTSRN